MSQEPASAPQASPRGRATFGDPAEAEEFVRMLERFERGEIDSEQYRQYRLSRGIYGQRQDGVQMVRVKIPQGVLSAEQLRVLAEVGEGYSRGYGHVTTRQNVQFHDVKTEHVPVVLEEVARVGLTTREACSHTVRNVAGCPYAGVCHGAPFDVTPYAEAITRHFLRRPYGSGLPRKFKIAASGCEDDCAQGAINDIGIVAQMQKGVRGFRILAGGGTATLARSAEPLHAFLPAEHLLASCEAIARVFHAEGERKDLKKARMKWAIRRLGWEGFKALYQKELDAILAEGGRPLPPGVETEEQAPPPRARHPKPPALAIRFAPWKTHHVRPQRQEGFVTALVWLRLGDISSAQLRGLAELTEAFGDGSVRTTQTQNLLLRWIPAGDVEALWGRLDALGLGAAHAESPSDVVSCPGAETCRIAVTASRGVAQLVGEQLRAQRQGQGAFRSQGTDIKVSGCPNGCGQHHIAAIGLQGGVRKVGNRIAPQYHLTIGGGIGPKGATFGRLVAKIPARRVPEAVDRLIADFETNRRGNEAARAYFQRLDVAVARKLLADLTELDEPTAKPEDFVDPGSNVAFEVVALDGECAS